MWTLRDHGDPLEQKWGEAVGAHFPNYEVFWVSHVVPLTFRPVDGVTILLRADLPEHLETLATYNYSVFLHLAAAHELAEHEPEIVASRMYELYSHLYSAGLSVGTLLAAVDKVLQRYGSCHIPDNERRLGRYGNRGLARRYRRVLEDRIDPYRGTLVRSARRSVCPPQGEARIAAGSGARCAPSTPRPARCRSGRQSPAPPGSPSRAPPTCGRPPHTARGRCRRRSRPGVHPASAPRTAR